MATNGSRFHIEINSIKVEDFTVRFNIFGDTLSQVTADLEQVIGYVTNNQLPTTLPSIAPKIAAPAILQAQKPTRQIT